MSSWARFWPVDLHVHTPGSSDAKAEDFGSADEIVAAALAAGLDAIAITDHNTAAWCDQVALAAKDSALIVLPGVEISTTEGHLLAIWEQGTGSTIIRDLLVRLGISTADHGKLDISAEVGIAKAAKEIASSGGVAIAAHVDSQKKGLLGMAVRAHLNKTRLDDCLSAVEIVKMETKKDVDARVSKERLLPCVRGSDTWDTANSRHSLSGIGARRTWIKASRPDLAGLKHALADPDLRLSLVEPAVPSYPLVKSIRFRSGFLVGQEIDLCPDLNCLLGGTGAGKSLVLEAIRFALNQQVDKRAFPTIRAEVDSRLDTALGDTGAVFVEFMAGGQSYRVERAYSRDGSAPPSLYQQIGDDWAAVDADPATLIPIAAFSQGEILEYSREPVGRMSLVDAGVDLFESERQIGLLVGRLAENSRKVIAARVRLYKLQVKAADQSELDDQVRKLASLFDTGTVKDQESWTKESTRFTRAIRTATDVPVPAALTPGSLKAQEVASNKDIFEQVNAVLGTLRVALESAVKDITDAKAVAAHDLDRLKKTWDGRFEKFRRQLEQELEKVSPEGGSLVTLRAHLEALQLKLDESKQATEELTDVVSPLVASLTIDRESMLAELHAVRKGRRELRRGRVAELNAKTAGFVKLDIPNTGDYADFRQVLNTIKVGSRVREDVLDAIAKYTHPLKFARALWDGDVNALASPEHGIDAASIAKLLANIDERNLWTELLDIQLIERPDVLTVSFKKPDDGSYTSIESLAHGQRCTAILVILLADGVTPVLVDQPEDALHAPWIEEYLVDRLRQLRGTRQYLFPTRSPGIVVSGDAEQIVTMRATAGHGELEAKGSLERHDLNKLVLHHLEGGPIPFGRRTRKLSVSTKL